MANLTLQEKIDEFKARISLLEGDRKAYYENSQWTMKQNKDSISKLRKENKEIRAQLSACLSADEHVLDKAFQERRVERAALKNKTGQAAITILDHKLSDHEKRLNQLKHETACKKQRAEELRTKYEEMLREATVVADTSKAPESRESSDSTVQRSLENRLDKALLKVSEAEQIKKTYGQIKAKLEEEALTFPSRLDAMADMIRKARLELKELKVMRSDALHSKEAAATELRKHEDAVYADRKRRDVELQQIKKEAEDARLHHEKTERRIAQRNTLAGNEEPTAQPEKGHPPQVELNSAKITTYEEAFRQIKEATGVMDALEVVARFEHQEETTHRLQGLKSNAESEMAELKAERAQLQKNFDDMKYSGDAKMSSGQLALEAMESSLSSEEARRVELLASLNEQNKTLFNIRIGVEHLHEKLKHLKTKGKQVQVHAPTSRTIGSATSSAINYDELVLDMLSATEDKLLKLLDDLDAHGVDLDAIAEDMEREEFHAQLEGKLPQYNTRVKLPSTQRDYVYDDEDGSGDDEGEIITRNGLKKQAELLLENKTKRRVVKRKK